MKPKYRKFQTENDFWRIRAFLRETYELHGRRQQNWPVGRLDYWRWHVLLNCKDMTELQGWIHLWETDDNQIAAVLNGEDPGSVFLQTHPNYRNPDLELEMITLAEEKLSIEREGQQILYIWAHPEDHLRMEILKQQGYSQGKWTESQWYRDLNAPIPEATIPDGYAIRSLGDIEEIPARSWASWRGFHPDSPDEAYEGWEWYLNVQRCPLYRRDLDIVVIAPTGEIASFCTFWYDDATRSAMIEPVATVPEHLRRGLARATITEGLRRVQAMGAIQAFVSGFGSGANALYASVLSPEHDDLVSWVKKW